MKNINGIPELDYQLLIWLLFMRYIFCFLLDKIKQNIIKKLNDSNLYRSVFLVEIQY